MSIYATPKFFKNFSFDIYRPTNAIVDAGTVPALSGSVTIARSVGVRARFVVIVASYTSWGAVTLTGTDTSDAAQTEVLTFTSNGTKSGVKTFNTLSSISVDFSNPQSGTISVFAKTPTGEQIQILTTYLTAQLFDYQPRASLIDKLRTAPMGTEVDAGATVYVPGNSDYMPQEQDVLVNAVLGRFQVINLGMWTSHRKILLKKL